MYDYLIRNGHIIDPKNDIDEVLDLAISGKTIAKVGKNITSKNARKVIDAKGLLVTPGLVDSHVHCYYSTGMSKAWAGNYGLQPDYFNFSSGVTTMVDVGSAGPYNFGDFKVNVIDNAKTRIFALLNICDYGMSSLQIEQFPEMNDFQAFLKCVDNYKDIIKGIKIAHYWGKNWADVEYAQKVQKEIDLPIMVDFGVFSNTRPYDELLIKRLRKGDITTHCFRAAVPVLDENGQVNNFMFKARKRGIFFDLGHGCASFMMRNGVPAMNQGFLPDTFSTDLHGLSINGTAIGMDNLLSKMLACCEMPLIDLFRRATVNPCKMLNLGDLVNLNEGSEADIAIWNLRKGHFGFQDMSGGRVEGSKKLECDMTFRAGEIVWDLNGRVGVPYKELPPNYGLDESKEDLITPTLN